MTTDLESQKTPVNNNIHRLPTISASQALTILRTKGKGAISTGLPFLDLLLSGHHGTAKGFNAETGGLVRGQIADIHGPPGAGKTAFVLSLCASVLRTGGRAVWIDTGPQVVQERLKDFLVQATGDDSVATATKAIQERFHYFSAPSLPHLLALVVHPASSFPPEGTSIIVVDSISVPFEIAYPRDGRQNTNSDASRWAAGRRYTVMSNLLSKLGKMAALHDLAVVLTRQTSTRLKQGAPAVLAPSMTSNDSDNNNITTQLCIYRDFPPHGSESSQGAIDANSTVRYIGITKGGRIAQDMAGEAPTNVVPFTIRKGGLFELNFEPTSLPDPTLSSPNQPAKRSKEVIEIGDSDGEDFGSDGDYGWRDEDDLPTGEIMETRDTVTEVDRLESASTDAAGVRSAVRGP